MIVCRLIGLEHHDWDKIKHSVGVGNLATVEHEAEWDKEEGLSYRVSYGGFVIGHIPLVPTLRTFYKKATSKAERDRNEAWGGAAVAVRLWLDSRVKYNHEEKWEIPVWGVLFRDENGYNTKDRGEPTQISLGFEL